MAANAGFINSTYLTRDSMAVQAVDGMGDMIVGAFDKIMTKAVNEGALLDGAGKLMDGVSNVADKAISSNPLKGPDVTPEVKGEDNQKSAPLISRAQEINQCPGGAEVAAQVSNSGLNLAHFKADSAMNVSEAALTGQGQGYSVSQSAMVAPTAAQMHQQAEQLSI